MIITHTVTVIKAKVFIPLRKRYQLEILQHHHALHAQKAYQKVEFACIIRYYKNEDLL